MKLGFDLDGVISDTALKAIEVFNKTFDKELSIDDIKTFNLIDNVYDEDPEKNNEYAAKLIEFVNDPLVQIECLPYKDAANALRKFRNWGHTIHIVTARPEDNYDMTVKWFRKNKIPYDSIILTGKKEKGLVGRSLNLDMFVDDFINNLESMWKFKIRWRKGLLLLDRPWNNDYIDINKFKRVYNWEEIIRHIGIQNR